MSTEIVFKVRSRSISVVVRDEIYDTILLAASRANMFVRAMPGDQ